MPTYFTSPCSDWFLTTVYIQRSAVAHHVAGGTSGLNLRMDLPRSPRHLQVTGRDVRGRKQYRYHAHWREFRGETKYEHMIAFGVAFRSKHGPTIAARC